MPTGLGSRPTFSCSQPGSSTHISASRKNEADSCFAQSVVYLRTMPQGDEEHLGIRDLVDESPVSRPELEESLELITGQRLVGELIQRGSMHLVELFTE